MGNQMVMLPMASPNSISS